MCYLQKLKVAVLDKLKWNDVNVCLLLGLPTVYSLIL